MKQDFVQKPEKYDGPIRFKDFYSDYFERISRLGISSVTELGMGSGDFLYHLPETVNGFGIDKSAELVAAANSTRKKDNLTFRCADIGIENDFAKTDLVIMSGFLCTFLEFEPVFETALSIATKYIFVNDYLNEHGVDAHFSFRADGESNFQTPYTIWSVATIEEYLNRLDVSYSIERYHMKTTLPETPNPLYNFHAQLDGENVLTNRGGIILNGYNIFIEKT